MSRRLPTIHRITDHDAGPYRMERMDLEFSNGERRQFERLRGRGHGAVAVVPLLDADTVLARVTAAAAHRTAAIDALLTARDELRSVRRDVVRLLGTAGEPSRETTTTREGAPVG